MPSCILYYCDTDPKCFTKHYTEVSNEFTITFNKDIDIMNPVFRFSKNVSALNFNYIFVPALDGRNYWVTSGVTYKAGYWEVQCHVDVIESWKNQIKNASAIVRRSGNLYNKYLSDDKFKAYQAKCERIIEMTPEDSNRAFSKDRTEFILCVVGNTVEQPEPEQQGGG